MTAVVRHLMERRGVARVALWGRSMGAVAALLHCQNDDEQADRAVQQATCALVLDSPFCRMSTLVDDLLERGSIWVPRFAVKGLLSMLRTTIKKRCDGAEVLSVDALANASACRVPAIFLSAKNDEMVGRNHSDALVGAHGGQVHQVRFERRRRAHDGGRERARARSPPPPPSPHP